MLLFSLSFMYNFILLLLTKEFIQPKMIVMTFPEINATTWGDSYAGFLVSTQYMYVLCIFNLGCVHVNIKRTNILHKCSKCHRVRARGFKKHAVVQTLCRSSRSSSTVVPSIPIK